MRRWRWAALGALSLVTIIAASFSRSERQEPPPRPERHALLVIPAPAPKVVAKPAPLPEVDTQGRELIVDWNAGLIYPLRNGHLVRGPILANPGQEFHGHYLGSFVITEKLVEHRSNLYNDHIGELEPGQVGADMPYWQRIGATAVGFHLSHLFEPEMGLHASMGCYRLSRASARWLFRWTDVGTPVHVVKSLCQSRYAYLDPDRCDAS